MNGSKRNIRPVQPKGVKGRGKGKGKTNHMKETWNDIMQALTGTRLAVYDDAIAAGKIETKAHEGTARAEALRWLVEHRLIEQTVTGGLRPVSVEEARGIWERGGRGTWKTNKEETSEKTQKEETHSPLATHHSPATATRHSHQGQFFDMEGYRA